jgi:hypothetical protein
MARLCHRNRQEQQSLIYKERPVMSTATFPTATAKSSALPLSAAVAASSWEFKTVSVPRSVAESRLATLEEFGWERQNMVLPVFSGSSATLFLRRDRNRADRAALDALLEEHTAAFEQVERLETSPEKVGRTVAIVAGLIGTAYIAGAVFSYESGVSLSFFMLAAVALIHAVLPFTLKKKIRTRRAAALAGRLATQRQILSDTLSAARHARDRA